MALENLLRKSGLAGRSRLSESLQLYQIWHPSAVTSPSGKGISRGETNVASMGVVQCCDLFLSQKLCRMCRDIVVFCVILLYSMPLDIRETIVF
jgi:hypothetical protein